MVRCVLMKELYFSKADFFKEPDQLIFPWVPCAFVPITLMLFYFILLSSNELGLASWIIFETKWSILPTITCAFKICV
jgi:hypothetical protein